MGVFLSFLMASIFSLTFRMRQTMFAYAMRRCNHILSGCIPCSESEVSPDAQETRERREALAAANPVSSDQSIAVARDPQVCIALITVATASSEALTLSKFMPLWKSIVSSAAGSPRRFEPPHRRGDQAAQRAQRRGGARQMRGGRRQRSAGALRGVADEGAGAVDRGGSDAGPGGAPGGCATGIMVCA